MSRINAKSRSHILLERGERFFEPADEEDQGVVRIPVGRLLTSSKESVDY